MGNRAPGISATNSKVTLGNCRTDAVNNQQMSPTAEPPSVLCSQEAEERFHLQNVALPHQRRSPSGASVNRHAGLLLQEMADDHDGSHDWRDSSVLSHSCLNTAVSSISLCQVSFLSISSGNSPTIMRSSLDRRLSHIKDVGGQTEKAPSRHVVGRHRHFCSIGPQFDSSKDKSVDCCSLPTRGQERDGVLWTSEG